MAVSGTETLLYLRNGLQKVHQNRFCGNSAISPTDIYGGLQEERICCYGGWRQYHLCESGKESGGIHSLFVYTKTKGQNHFDQRVCGTDICVEYDMRDSEQLHRLSSVQLLIVYVSFFKKRNKICKNNKND